MKRQGFRSLWMIVTFLITIFGCHLIANLYDPQNLGGILNLYLPTLVGVISLMVLIPYIFVKKKYSLMFMGLLMIANLLLAFYLMEISK